MKTFVLLRLIDHSGVSGTGIVAEGVKFSNGRCVVCWLSSASSIEIWDNIDDLTTVHGHGGATQVVWVEPPTTSS